MEGSEVEIPEFNVSYKPQKISPKFHSTVGDLLCDKIHNAITNSQFISDVMKHLMIDKLMDQQVLNLSGGELQRVALCLSRKGTLFHNNMTSTADSNMNFG